MNISDKKDLLNILYKTWNKKSFDDPKLYGKAVSLFNKIFHDKSAWYNIAKHKKIKQGCKSCHTTVIKKLQHLIFGKLIPVVSNQEFLRRKQVCQSCDLYFQKPDMCGECGCFIFLKAWIDDCPHPEGDKWKL